MNSYATALVVGKFAPLHQGHLFLLDTAQHHSQKLIILSYCKPEPVGCMQQRRYRWLKQHYPNAELCVLDETQAKQLGLHLPDDTEADDIHRHFCADLLQKLGHTQVDAVFSSEAYGPGFAKVLTQRLQRQVDHVSVDPSRTQLPVSASQIRSDLPAMQHWLAEGVADDLVAQRVCLLGGESSGKTTLAAALAQSLDSIWVPEYGRERWEQQQGILLYEDLLAIAQEQVRREDKARWSAKRWLICDTSPMTTLLYCQSMFGRAERELELLAERHYEQTFLCAPDFDFVQDGTRRDEAFQHWQHHWYKKQLQSKGIPYHIAKGSVAERVAFIQQKLALANDATHRQVAQILSADANL